MLNANKILGIFRESVDYGLNNTGGENNKIDRFKNNVLNKFKNELKKIDKSIKVYDFNSDDIKDGYIVSVADNYECYSLGLPFISQLTYIENDNIKLRAVYSYCNEQILYTFDNKDMYSKDKHISIRFTKKPKIVKLIAIDNINAASLLGYVTEVHKEEKIISYYSVGVMLFKLILGELEYCYTFGLDKNSLKEILWLCECNSISIRVINNIYKFSI